MVMSEDVIDIRRLDIVPVDMSPYEKVGVNIGIDFIPFVSLSFVLSSFCYLFIIC